jgi:hypothetical protein
MFNNLTRVGLRMRDNQFHKEREVCRESATGLTYATNLKHLELDTRGVECPLFYKEIATLNIQRPWPVLEHLRRSGTIVSEELLQILNLCCDSLCELEIEDVLLLKPDSRGARWDDLIKAMQPGLTLQRANVNIRHDRARRFEGILFSREGAKSAIDLTVEGFLTKSCKSCLNLKSGTFRPGARTPCD